MPSGARELNPPKCHGKAMELQGKHEQAYFCPKCQRIVFKDEWEQLSNNVDAFIGQLNKGEKDNGNSSGQ